MQMTYTSGRISFTQEVASGKQAFELVAKIAEVFDESRCGVCKSENIRPKVNQTDDKTYYKMVCECGAELSLWPTRDGKGLFIGRKDKDKNVLPDGGWKVWKREGTATASQGSEAKTSKQGGSAGNDEIPFAHVNRQDVLQVLGDETASRVLSAPCDVRWASRQVQSMY